MKPHHHLLLFLALFSSAALGADWQNISDSVTSRVKPGEYGPTAGVVVDRTNGAVFMVVNNQGLWRSMDHGTTFERCDGNTIGIRCETGWGLQADPAGQHLACFMVYGSSAITRDGGKTWTKFKTSHFDFGSVDWADSGQRFLALRHESGGMLTTTSDGGATWQDLGKGFKGCGVIDHNIFVATKEKEAGIFRSTDAGATWTRVFPETPAAAVPILFNGAAYWMTGKGLLVSRDKGASWSSLGSPVDALYGPFFASESHFVVAGKSGFSETHDAGKTWQSAAPLPPGLVVKRGGPNFAWDPKSDIFYASAMDNPTSKLERSKK